MEKTIISFPRQLELGEKLSNIQFEFKAQKSNFNAFGKYKFRSAEDILEALKPYNKKYKVYFTINESLINANPPIMQSIATIFDVESGVSIDAQAIVEIDKEQKGMAMPQRYGSASSYGKKYALGNLLLIDDTKDSDATNTHGNEPKKEFKEKPTLTIDSQEFTKAIDYIAGGGDIKIIETKYNLTAEVKTALTKK
jgi:hypothetical protein